LYYTPSGIHFVDEGSGKPIVLVHGAFGSLEDWSPISSILKNSFRIIALDLKGHGKSAPIEGRCNLDIMALAVNDVINHLKLNKYVLVCTSLGAAVALRCAIARIKGLEKLVLIAPLIKGPSTIGYKMMKFLHKLGAVNLRKLITEATLRELKEPGEDLALKVKSKLKSIPEDFFFNIAECIVSVNLRDALGLVRVPTLIIVGDEDRLTPLKHVSQAPKKQPNIKVKVLEKAGHLLILERSSEVAQLIADFTSK